jgi:hypothetical protein
MTIQEFIEATGLQMTTIITDKNPCMPDFQGAKHWLCDISSKRSEAKECTPFSLVFSQGSAHKNPPTLLDVLNCIHCDFEGLADGATFEQWAADCGFDSDSHKAEGIFKTIVEQRNSFADLLPVGYLQTFMEDIEEDCQDEII